MPNDAPSSDSAVLSRRTGASAGDAGADRLRLYRLLSRIGHPQTFVGKITLVTSAATALPLLVSLGYLVAAPRDTGGRIWAAVIAVIVAVLGLLLAQRALRAALAPLVLSRRALAHYFETGDCDELPRSYTDEAGLLMRDVAAAIDRFHAYRLRLEEYAAYDALTGLLNRRAAEDRLHQSFSLLDRGGTAICVAMLDLDRFKQVNDRYGHGAGDRVLVAVAAQMRSLIRGADWASRWGGEEFLLLLHASPEGAAAALERVRTAIEALEIDADGVSIRCTVSGGYTTVSVGESIPTAVQHADSALYRAKHAGRNRIHYDKPVDDPPTSAAAG